MTELVGKRCLPCEGGVAALNSDEIQRFLLQVPAWQVNANNTIITRQFEFKNYYQTMTFVNAVAWLAHQENHHPDMLVSYQQCVVNYNTHAVNGLTENDFICAAKVDVLLEK